MPRKKFDSGKIRVLILDVYAACPEPDTSPYFRFSQEYGFVSTNIGTMTQFISHSVIVFKTRPNSARALLAFPVTYFPIRNRIKV